MNLQIDRVQKPLRQLRKSLKRLPNDPPPETVHNLRTRARKIEAIATALTESDKKKARRLLKSIKPVRKAAGGVRDMDVLTGNALTLPQNSHRDSLVRLIEQLAIARQRNADELVDTVGQQRKTARHILKQYAKLVETTLTEDNADSTDTAKAHAELHVQAVTKDLMEELSHWPALNARNIHAFRLKVKELRYILQLSLDSNSSFVDALGSVKDQIGDWHDWQQLAETARQMLDPTPDRALLIQIEKIGKQKLRKALASAEALRKRYLKARTARSRSAR